MLGNINNKYKTTLCRHYITTGTCQIGARCHFAHGKEELRNPNDAFQMQNGVGNQNNLNQQQMAINPQALQDPNVMSTYVNGSVSFQNYKTIKCRYFELGICKYKDTCHFAHGDMDMKIPQTDAATMNQLILAQQYNQLLQQQQQLQQTGANPQQLQNQASQVEQMKLYQAQQLQAQQQAQIQQAQQQNNYSVSQDPAIQKQITVQQLYYIIQHIDQLNTSAEIRTKVKMATELLQAQNIQACSTLLNEVINRQDVNQEERKAYEKIISDASQLAVNMMAQYQVQSQVNQYQGTQMTQQNENNVYYTQQGPPQI